MGTLGKAAVPGSRTASRDRNRDREPRIKARAGQAESGKRSERERHEGRGERSEGRGHAAPENDRLMAGFDGNPRSESAESDLSKPSRPQTSASPLVGIDATGSPRERPSGRSRFSVKTRQIRENLGRVAPECGPKAGPRAARPLFNRPRRPPSRMGALCPSRPRRPLESRAAHTPLEPRASPVPHSRRPRQPQAANARQNRSFAKRAPPRRRPAPAIAASRTNARAGRARVRRKDGRQGRPPASETSPRSGSAPCDRLPRRPRTPPRQPRAASRRRTHGVRPRARRRRAPPR